MKTTRDSLSYDIDGLVEEVNDYEVQEQMGYDPSGLKPKFATAIKFDSVASVTPLESIRWTVGMTGRVIPTAIYKPIDIMGVTVTKSTMHNYEFLENTIKKEGLKIGAECIVIRSGDVIPKYLGVKKSGDGKEIQIPDNCPVCGEPLDRFSVDLVCENTACGAKTAGIFTNMFDTLKLKGLSDKFVSKVIDMYDVKTIDDLMRLSADDFEKLPGYAKKSAQKAYDTIHSVTEVSPEQFFALLNIPNQGVRVFENLFAQFPMEKLLDEDFKPEDIMDTKGIAEKTAHAINDGIQSNLDRLRENAEWFTIKKKIKKEVDKSQHSNAMVGKTFCITGTLNNGTRKDYEEQIEAKGGKASGSVNAKLHYLVTNEPDTNSSKMKKARELNVKWENDGKDQRILIISEDDLIKMMEK
jgi:DNA ligase (NAD+)